MKILPQIYTNCSRNTTNIQYKIIVCSLYSLIAKNLHLVLLWLVDCIKVHFFLILISRKIPWKIPWKLPPRCCCLWIKSAEMYIYNRKRPAGTSELHRGCTSEAENYGRGTLRDKCTLQHHYIQQQGLLLFIAWAAFNYLRDSPWPS